MRAGFAGGTTETFSADEAELAVGTEGGREGVMIHSGGVFIERGGRNIKLRGRSKDVF